MTETGITSQNTVSEEYISEPVSMSFIPVRGSYDSEVVAFRTNAVINSAKLGVLTPEDYSFAVDKSPAGFRLAEWCVKQALKAAQDMLDSGRNLSWISVRCPAGLADQPGVYERIFSLIEANNFMNPSKLCLEFPQSVLFGPLEAARVTMLDMKLLGVKTMLTGCAADDCPVTRLAELPVDMALMDKSYTALVNDRNKPNLVRSFVEYLESMNVKTVADGVKDTEAARALNRFGCEYYLPSESFAVSKEWSTKPIGFREAISLLKAAEK